MSLTMKHLKMKQFSSDPHKRLKVFVHSVSNRAMLNSTSNYITITIENELCIRLKHIFSVTMIAMIDTNGTDDKSSHLQKEQFNLVRI